MIGNNDRGPGSITVSQNTVLQMGRCNWRPQNLGHYSRPGKRKPEQTSPSKKANTIRNNRPIISTESPLHDIDNIEPGHKPKDNDCHSGNSSEDLEGSPEGWDSEDEKEDYTTIDMEDEIVEEIAFNSQQPS